ncbi:MAG: ATP-binding protein [Lachnospiraceae bacterium]|nr:ATP-binding protein [Lachnospiraceae bacterium]
MKQFIDRQTELAVLEAEYKRKGASLVILYGRRRVGKTALISHFIRNKNALFFLASEESESQNRNVFKDIAATFIDSTLLRESSVSGWDVIFQTVMEMPFRSKPVIVIDEFQYIGKSNPAFPSVFQRIWETILKDKSVMVILCGSLISMMESQTLSYHSPLYGRRTAQIRLQQIPFRHYRGFFPKVQKETLVAFYALTGGVPKYIRTVNAEKDVYAAIDHHVLNMSGFLYQEPDFLLQQEVAEIGSYFSIIKVIAAGNRKLSAMSGMLGIKSTGLTKYLRTLIDLDILEREVPVTESNPDKSKKGLYRIKDHFLRFWFLFVFPNRGLLESGNRLHVQRIIRRDFVSAHVAYVYEDICREKMWELNDADIWPFHFTKVGRWWDAHMEIDIVALDEENKKMILGECKYRNKPVGTDILRELEEKGQLIPWNREEREVWYILFSISGFTTELEDIARERKNLVLRQ